MATGTPGFMPRRSSYASVVSGTAVGSPHQYSQVMRSGAFAHLAHAEVNPVYDFTSYHNLGGQSRRESQAYDMDLSSANGGTHGGSGSWGFGRRLPRFSSAFGPLVNGYASGGLGGGHVDHFFIPSYLKGSKYVQRLEDAYRAKIAAHKEGHSTHSSQPGSLSTSASSINLHTKIAPSHRGMTYDLIEKAPQVEDDMLAPLPSRWNSQDKYGGLEVLSDGQEVQFTGPKAERERDLEACAIRAEHPMPPQCGIYYFEVTILSRKREESSIGIGFSSKNVPLSRLPGWEPESWAYHGDDGHSFCCNSSGKHYGPPFNAGDIIGCGVNFRSNSAFFTKNGDHLGTAFHNVNKEKLYPSVGMKKAGEHVRVNFGHSPFVFDIDGMMSASSHFSYTPSSSSSSSSSSFASSFAYSTGDSLLVSPTSSPVHVFIHQAAPADEPPPLITPSPRRHASTDLHAAVRGDTTVNFSESSSLRAPAGIDLRFAVQGGITGVSWIRSPSRDLDNALSGERPPTTARILPSRSSLGESATPDHRRSERTTALLNTLQQQSRERILSNTQRHIIRIASGIDEHRASLLSSGSTIRELGRIAASERALDDLGDRITPEIFPTLAALHSNMSQGLGATVSYLPVQIARYETEAAQTLSLFGSIYTDVDPTSEKPRDVRKMTNVQKQLESRRIRQQIELTSTVNLALPLSETELIQSLVLQYLSHEGYAETARAFAEEVHSEKEALSLDPNAIIEGVDAKGDEDAGHRQRIRQAVLEGDVDKALRYTHAYCPNVLKDDEHVSFRLKCRKFIEMIRQGAVMLNSSHSNGFKKSNGHNGDSYDDVAQGMDLDDHQSQANNWDRMDTAESAENQSEYQLLVQETLAYGQALQAEYKDDPRREIRRALADAFGLMAYTDPLNAKEVSHHLDPMGRAAVAEELNSAILLSLGHPATSALEKLIQQSTILLEELEEAGGPGAFVRIDDFVKVRPTNES